MKTIEWIYVQNKHCKSAGHLNASEKVEQTETKQLKKNNNQQMRIFSGISSVFVCNLNESI